MACYREIEQEEKKERANNLKLVHLLEEQERLRRMKESREDYEQYNRERAETKKLVIQLEEEERERRMAEHRETQTQVKQIRVESRRKSIQLEEEERLRRIQQFQEPTKSTITQRRNSLRDEEKPCATRRLRHSHDGSLECVNSQPEIFLDKLIKKRKSKVSKNLKSILREHPQEVTNVSKLN
jgi:transcriptional regulator of met regulon